MNLIRISESEDFFVDYDKDRGMYRVSVFKDNHFQDEYWFDCYEEKEFDNRVDKIINKLEGIKVDLTKTQKEKNVNLNASNTEHLFNLLIDWIKTL